MQYSTVQFSQVPPVLSAAAEDDRVGAHSRELAMGRELCDRTARPDAARGAHRPLRDASRDLEGLPTLTPTVISLLYSAELNCKKYVLYSVYCSTALCSQEIMLL